VVTLDSRPCPIEDYSTRFSLLMLHSVEIVTRLGLLGSLTDAQRSTPKTRCLGLLSLTGIWSWGWS
jgi:hypothetical protein